ncbi:glycoside hydrolase family 2 protein [Xylariaceae sp. FL1019]|nr:glycoside hydrolase family 2 protein [Xylariaceae sp. FL1019]
MPSYINTTAPSSPAQQKFPVELRSLESCVLCVGLAKEMLRLMSLVSRGLWLRLLLLLQLYPVTALSENVDITQSVRRRDTTGRERTSLNQDWKFSRFESNPDALSYTVLKDWILPCGNDFIVNGTKHQRPTSPAPGQNVTYSRSNFDDGDWESVSLPHDWAVKGPFGAPGISGGMGRLPSNGVGWYRKTITLTTDDLNKKVFLDIDGAMSYSAVWLNAELGPNQLAIRLDNALDSSRWYPGAGLYRDVWLVKVDPVHVRQYGTYITTPDVSTDSATLNLVVEVENMDSETKTLDMETTVYAIDLDTGLSTGDVVAIFESRQVVAARNSTQSIHGSTTIDNPSLWGPPPSQKPNMYVAITVLASNGETIDVYTTNFGVRSITYDANKGLLVNGEHVYVQGTCNHHDQGSLGAAFHNRAATRQLEILQSMGSNALRTTHNPPAPAFLDIADRLGFLVYDEIFDCWEEAKVTNDYHLIFSDWKEPDLRSFLRRDRNHPSVIAWGIGNEIPEQRDASGVAIGRELRDIAQSEDSTRPVTMALNVATGTDAIAGVLDIEGLNYQGEGFGTSYDSSFPTFHSAQPSKMIWSSESSSAVSSRGTFLFPVTPNRHANVGEDSGENSTSLQVSSYELYGVSWGASPDKVFLEQDNYTYVAGEFVWTGFDYIGEPTPYDDEARSSYFGIVDMAGFKKDRFFLYQARWRPDYPMAHILPHWTWPDRVGQVTPVHVFSSGDSAELFVNGKSVGIQNRTKTEYRFRWDDVTYQAGELRVVTYKGGKEWATDTKVTAGPATRLNISADRSQISGDGQDLSYISIAVVDANSTVVPRADNIIVFSIDGPAEIVATDNGNPADMTAFPSLTRKAFSGYALAIVRAVAGSSGTITVSATSDGLESASVAVQAR